jgi:hypothetical protein
VSLAVVAVAIFAGLVINSSLNLPRASQAISFKAAIIDELSSTNPNASFIDDVRGVLAASGYSVDYYSPDQVTVDLFRSLPSKDYGLVIIRDHSTGTVPGHPVTIITSEPWRGDAYVWEQLTDIVQSAKFPDNRSFFSIGTSFVKDYMQGAFPNSVIIMMGCSGLNGAKGSAMAQAFIDRGARAYISWDKSVTPDRTDTATITLLRSLVAGKTIGQAINATDKSIGPDQVFDSRLSYYPENQGGIVLATQPTQMPMLAMSTSMRPIRWRAP